MKKIILIFFLLFSFHVTAQEQYYQWDNQVTTLSVPLRGLLYFPLQKIKDGEWVKLSFYVNFNDYFIKNPRDHIGIILDGNLDAYGTRTPLRGRGITMGLAFGCFGVGFENFQYGGDGGFKKSDGTDYCDPVELQPCSEYFVVVMANKDTVYYQVHAKDFLGPMLSTGSAYLPDTVPTSPLSSIIIGATTTSGTTVPSNISFRQINYEIVKE